MKTQPVFLQSGARVFPSLEARHIVPVALLLASIALTAPPKAAGAEESALTPVITAKDYSGFIRGDGYGAPDFVPPSDLDRIGAERVGDQLILTWSNRVMLQMATNLPGTWSDVAGASSPYAIELGPESGIGSLTRLAHAFYRLRGVAGVHSGVGTGCPQQGFDFTALPADHWANHPATPTQCGWIVPELLTGFADVAGSGLGDDFVRVVLRSFSISNNWTWWEGNSPSWQDDAIHQNDGWFHFRVRHPDPGGSRNQYRLRFELAFDNPYAFTNGPLQLNNWWVDGTWDWESRNGRHVFTPMYRVRNLSGHTGPWHHIAESDVHVTEGYTNSGRHYRCRFELLTANAPWTEIEVAQNLPYTLEDRDRLWQSLRTTYPPQHPDLGLRKRHLGYGGLYYAQTNGLIRDAEFNELYAIEVFRKRATGGGDVPDLPNDRIVIVLTGVDYEPAGNWAAEGFLREVLDHWSDPAQAYRDRASYVVIPIGNPDAYEWATCHIIPYGNGYADNVMQRGYAFLEPESSIPTDQLDPEGQALRNYFKDLTQHGLDGKGGDIVVLLNFESDLCPPPNRWNAVPPPPFDVFPPIYGGIGHSDVVSSNAAVQLIQTLRTPADCPHTAAYVRNPNTSKGWWKYNYAEYGIPLFLTFEFDGAALYSESSTPPAWVAGQFAEPIRLPGRLGIPTFFVHGYLDQVGQALTRNTDPAYVFKLFGRDIATATRLELLP